MPPRKKVRPARTPAQTRIPWFKRRWMKGAGLALAAAALVGSGALFVSRQSKKSAPSLPPAPRISIADAIEQAKGDRIHPREVPRPTSDEPDAVAFIPRSKIAIIIPKRCAACHSPSVLSLPIERNIVAAAQSVSATYPTVLPLQGYRFRLGMDPAKANPSMEKGGETDSSQSWVEFSPAALAHPFVRNYVIDHELVHALTNPPGAGLSETWAYPFPLIRNPSLLFDHKSNQTLPQHIITFLDRAMFLARKPGTLNPASRKPIKEYQDNLSPHDIEAAGSLYTEALKTYQKDPLAWDTLAYHTANPMIMVDALVANQLAETSPAFRARISNPAYCARGREILESIAKSARQGGFRPSLEDMEASDSPDPRLVFILNAVKHGIPEGEADVLYFATVKSMTSGHPLDFVPPKTVRWAAAERLKDLGINRGNVMRNKRDILGETTGDPGFHAAVISALNFNLKSIDAHSAVAAARAKGLVR